MASFYPVVIGDEVAGIGVVAVDVTARVQAEGFRSTVMSQVADGVYTQDPDGRLTYMNRAACRMLGWSEEELRGKSVHEVIHVSQVQGAGGEPRECALLVEGTDHRLVQVADEAFVRKDGTTFPVAYSSMPLQAGGRTDGTSVVFRDIGTSTTSSNLIRVLIADADPTSAKELRTMLTRHEGLDVVGEAATADATKREVDRLHPDVVIVDVGLPGVGGSAAILAIKRDAPSTSAILLVNEHDDVVAAGAIAAGCSGVVERDRSWVELASAVRAAYHGETTISQAELQRVVHAVRDSWQPGRAEHLTAREREVLVCLTQGLSNQQAATRLGVTVNTVRNHVQRILYKLGVHSRLEAVVLASRAGILDPVT
jgi:PAS domain S-box-containing protein